MKIECMNTHNQLEFITSKIEELETAVLHSHCNSVLNIKSTIVKTRQVDENGHIWFTISKPQQQITEFEKQFPVALNYYKKGSPFFMNVFGVARIVCDPEELTCADLNNHIHTDNSKETLLCVKILNANYYEKEAAKNTSWLTKCKNALLGIFAFDEDNHYYWNLRTDGDKNFA
jgi:general stress protein 26